LNQCMTLNYSSIYKLLLLSLGVYSGLNLSAVEEAGSSPDLLSFYEIDVSAAAAFRSKNAFTLLGDYLLSHPEMKQRLMDENYIIAGENWSYRDQVYKDEQTLRHLIALQIKAMAERNEITTMNEAFSKRYGIGSKFHKDKGAINNIFSIWGHPVRKEILQGGSSATRHVYALFRDSIKNQLIRFLRSQPLEWHLMDAQVRTQAILAWLNKHYPVKTKKLEAELQEINLSLELLIQRTLSSHLLSFSVPTQRSVLLLCRTKRFLPVDHTAI